MGEFWVLNVFYEFFVHRTKLFLDSIRYQETIFALPFAYTGMLLASQGFPSLYVFSWISVAMVSARTVGMASNRIFDRNIDAINPRNKNRHLPSGLLTVRYMSTISFFAALIFLFSAYMLNWLSFFLAPLALIYMLIYPFAKRFTWASNLMLGWVLAIAPSAAWIGVKGTLNVEPILLSCAVALWAASFDIIYHVQDFDFYRNYGFHSIAQKFGIRLSLIFARILDLVALVLLVLLGYLMELSFTYYIGIMISIGFLLYKHMIISVENLSRIGPSFFRINAYVSISIFMGTLVSIIV